MSATHSADLIGELDLALKSGSAQWRVLALQRLSALLPSCAERLSPSQAGLFDDVLARLLDCGVVAAGGRP